MNQNAKSRQSIFVTLEFTFGLGFGIFGGYAFLFSDKGDITASVYKTFSIVIISIIIGVALVGYF